MKPNKIWLVVPFSRPNFLENVKENIKRQTYKDIKLCIVENGDADGYCKKVGFEPDLLLKSAQHQSSAKNTGIDEIKKKYPGSYVSIFDDDDYYGPNYLQEVYDNSDKADVVGKLCIITKLTNDEMVLTHDVGYYNTYVPYVQSATASYWADDAFPYSEILKSGEENFWAGQMTRSGRKIYSTSPFNFCYIRRDKGHTYSATDQQFIDRGARPLGRFDLDIINRVKHHQMLEQRMSVTNDFIHQKMRHETSKQQIKENAGYNKPLTEDQIKIKDEYLRLTAENNEKAKKVIADMWKNFHERKRLKRSKENQ